MKRKIVIVGGVAGGATAAARLRRLSENYEIIMFEKDEYIAFANCGLPYYIGEEITERSNLLVQTVDAMSLRYNLDIRNNSLVESINTNDKTVSVRNLKTNEVYNESYDKLLLSPGASPIKPNFEGLKTASNVYTLRNIPDTDKIKAIVDTNDVKTAVVIGGGFIGVEMAENLALRGIDVTLIDQSKHILRPFDVELASILELELKNNNIKLILDAGVADVTQDYVILEDGTKVSTDLTIMAIGVVPNSELTKNTDIKINSRGAIIVDEKLQTSVLDVYAVGDVIELTNGIDGEKASIPLAGPANRQARLVADIIHGIDVNYTGSIGASVLKVIDLTAASVGYTSEYLTFKNIDHESVIVHRASHATYYPDSSMITLKLVFDKITGKIYGAQAVGKKGVEKRIDVISTAIQAGLNVFDLPDLELTYAPPFNSAKDPVNILGYTAVNLIEGMTKMYKFDFVDTVINDDKKLLIDIRSNKEYENSHIKSAISFNVDLIRDQFENKYPDKNQEIYLYCQVGLRGYVAEKILNDLGYMNVYNLSGGKLTYETYKNNLNK